MLWLFYICYKLPRECAYVKLIHHLVGNIYSRFTLDIEQYMSYIKLLYGSVCLFEHSVGELNKNNKYISLDCEANLFLFFFFFCLCHVLTKPQCGLKEALDTKNKKINS